MNFTPSFETSNQQKQKFESITKYMATNLVTFSPDDEIGYVIKTLIDRQISGAPVVGEKRELLGVISEQDILRVIVDSVYHNQPISKEKVKDHMSDDVMPIEIDSDVMDVANLFLKHRFRRFPVVENGILKGQVSKRDILRAAKNLKPTTW